MIISGYESLIKKEDLMRYMELYCGGYNNLIYEEFSRINKDVSANIDNCNKQAMDN